MSQELEFQEGRESAQRARAKFRQYYNPDLAERLRENFGAIRIEEGNWVIVISDIDNWFHSASVAIALFNYFESEGQWELIQDLLEYLLKKAPDNIAGKSTRSLLLWQLGRIASNRGKADQAIIYLTQGLAIASELSDKELEEKFLYEFGAEYMDRGKYREARYYLERALLLSSELENRKEGIYITGQISNALLAEGKGILAAQRLEKILPSWYEFTKDKDRWLANTTMHALGRIYIQLGLLERAREVLLESLKLKELLQSGKGLLARTRCLLSESCLKLNRLDEAEFHLEKALSDSRAVGDIRYLAIEYRLVAMLHAKKKEWEKAFRANIRSTGFALDSQVGEVIWQNGWERIKYGFRSGNILGAAIGLVQAVQALKKISISPLPSLRLAYERMKLNSSNSSAFLCKVSLRKQIIGHSAEDSFDIIYQKNISAVIVADGITRDPNGSSYLPDTHKITGMMSFLLHYPHPSPAKKAADLLCQTFLDFLSFQNAGMLLTSTAENLLQKAFGEGNFAIHSWNKKNFSKIDYLQNDYGACVASGGIIINTQLFWGYVCDCGICVFDRVGRLKFRTANDMRPVEEHLSLSQEDWRDPAWRKKVRSQYRNNSQNIVNGQISSYGALTGETSALSFIKTGCVQLSEGDFVFFYSDGAETLLFSDDFAMWLLRCGLNGIDTWFKKNRNKIDGAEATIIGVRIDNMQLT